jgi:hypothetical protein
MAAWCRGVAVRMTRPSVGSAVSIVKVGLFEGLNAKDTRRSRLETGGTWRGSGGEMSNCGSSGYAGNVALKPGIALMSSSTIALPRPVDSCIPKTSE